MKIEQHQQGIVSDCMEFLGIFNASAGSNQTNKAKKKPLLTFE
jgi:hypothetical protein